MQLSIFSKFGAIIQYTIFKVSFKVIEIGPKECFLEMTCSEKIFFLIQKTWVNYLHFLEDDTGKYTKLNQQFSTVTIETEQ